MNTLPAIVIFLSSSTRRNIGGGGNTIISPTIIISPTCNESHFHAWLMLSDIPVSCHTCFVYLHCWNSLILFNDQNLCRQTFLSIFLWIPINTSSSSMTKVFFIWYDSFRTNVYMCFDINKWSQMNCCLYSC